MKKSRILIIVLLMIILSPLYSKNLIWWFKTEGKNQWLKIGIPYIILESVGLDNNYLLGFNYPKDENEEIKYNEDVSIAYILKKGMEIKADKIYTGTFIITGESELNLKIKIYDISNFTYKVISIEAKTIRGLASKTEFKLTNDQVFVSSLKDLRELKYIALAISKFNSERIKILEEGLKQFENSKTLREIYIKSLLEEEEYDKLVEFLSQPVTMKEYRIRIYALIKSEEFEDAKTIIEKIENKNSLDYNNLAICYLKCCSFKTKAKELLLKALKENKKDWRLFYNLSLLEYNNNKIRFSKKHLISSLMLNFNNNKQLKLLKEILKKLKKDELGEFSNSQIFNVLIKPTSYYDRDGKLEYIPISEKAKNSNNDEYFLKEGLSFLKQKEYKLAEKLMKRQLYITSFNDNLYFYLSYINLKLGKIKDALLYVETANFLKNRLKYLLYKFYIYKTSDQQEKALNLYLYLKKNFPANTNIEKINSNEEIDWLNL